ncbi:MAG: helicase SNF2 [Phycisphaera sp.]|nr:helicase SNF2 [Phycisphaera sp.]
MAPIVWGKSARKRWNPSTDQPMSLIKTWAPFFQAKVRARGRGYFLSNRVEQVPTLDGEWVRAQVRGSQVYEVALRTQDSQLSAECTCAFFQGGSYCKHIWATILHVQNHGVLSPGSSHGNGQSSTDHGQIDHLAPRPPKARKRTGPTAPQASDEPTWMGRLSLLRPYQAMGVTEPTTGLLSPRQMVYSILPARSETQHSLVIELLQRTPTATGWARPKKARIDPYELSTMADPTDRELCALILGAEPIDSLYDNSAHNAARRGHALFMLPRGVNRSMMKKLIETRRCVLSTDELEADLSKFTPIEWDGQDDHHWRLWLTGKRDENNALRLDLEVRRAGQIMAIDQPVALVGGFDGVVIYTQTDPMGKTRLLAAEYDDDAASRWAQQFRDRAAAGREDPTLIVPEHDIPGFLDRLYLMQALPELDLPPRVGKPEEHVEPVPCVEVISPTTLGKAGASDTSRSQLTAYVWFEYGKLRVRPEATGQFVATRPDEEGADVLVRRDRDKEHHHLSQLISAGFRAASETPSRDANSDALLLPAKSLPSAVASLLEQGWRVWADQKAIRRPANTFWSVSSGIDWFELRGGVRFDTEQGERIVDLMDILAAARAGRSMIELGDGTQGMLAMDWLRQQGLLTALGKAEGDHLRFKSSQAVLLDALLDSQSLVSADALFELAREKLRSFDRISARDARETFRGSLRPYQREGLGWFDFLQQFGMGGVLADDMGLGKTVQVLAMLDAVYGESGQVAGESGQVKGKESESAHSATGPLDHSATSGHKPSLIVVPRSVVFNWIDEAARFAPKLRVQAYTGADRSSLREAFKDHDVIVTSYSLMRRDIAELREHEFEYVVLDEAQAIKNPTSQSAKAARLLPARHRLALTGTPVENHVGDLWSIFEFLNPGMLGSSTRFASLVKGGSQNPTSVEAARATGRALRPFILRRTKKQVLTDLPEKTEQTILCQMDAPQRRMYDKLLRHYRDSLLKQPGSSDKSGTSPMMVLEALLRLRQAACHPGLIDEKLIPEPSAKLETLLVRLQDLIDEGHKALVFSQFTSLLSIVRRQLDATGVPYEYLDGQTQDRQTPVKRFQEDPSVPIFLISLKAGGLGLNLTAAGYVFILDPWWNPAVEAQAIDRAHRIGQTQHVFAYRLVCEDTVEQRILELQSRKRALADAIVEGQDSLMSNLSRADLEMLLS